MGSDWRGGGFRMGTCRTRSMSGRRSAGDTQEEAEIIVGSGGSTGTIEESIGKGVKGAASRGDPSRRPRCATLRNGRCGTKRLRIVAEGITSRSNPLTFSMTERIEAAKGAEMRLRCKRSSPEEQRDTRNLGSSRRLQEEAATARTGRWRL